MISRENVSGSLGSESILLFIASLGNWTICYHSYWYSFDSPLGGHLWKLPSITRLEETSGKLWMPMMSTYGNKRTFMSCQEAWGMNLWDDLLKLLRRLVLQTLLSSFQIFLCLVPWFYLLQPSFLVVRVSVLSSTDVSWLVPKGFLPRRDKENPKKWSILLHLGIRCGKLTKSLKKWL